MTTYTATAADGQTYTRKTERTYTHAVIITWPEGRRQVKFAGRRDLAEKTVANFVSAPRWASPEMRQRLDALREALAFEIVEAVAR
jgi:hypothetical protein